MSERLTKARRIVLLELAARGGKATPWDLSSPRSDMMHRLTMAGYVEPGGRLDAWGEPRSFDGFWTLTEAGRALLRSIEGGERG